MKRKILKYGKQKWLPKQKNYFVNRTFSSFEAKTFTPLVFPNLNEAFDMPALTIEGERGEILCNSKVFRAKEKNTGNIAYIKHSNHFKSREQMGIDQPSTQEATAFTIREATANALARKRLGGLQIPKTGIAWTKDGEGNPMTVLVSKEIKHQGTLHQFYESAGINLELNPHESILFIGKDGLTYAKLIGDGVHGEKDKEYTVRVKGRLDLKAGLMLLGHSDVENHHNNIYIKTEYNAAEHRYIARPGIFDLGNCFMDMPLAKKYGSDIAPLVLAYNPLDDMVPELHLNDFAIAKRWVAKQDAFHKMLGHDEFDNAVFDWQEQLTPEPYKHIAQYCREDFMSNKDVIRQAATHLDMLCGVAELLRKFPIPETVSAMLGNDIIEIKKGSSPSDSMAFLDRCIERKVGLKPGERVEGEKAQAYHGVLQYLAHTLDLEKQMAVRGVANTAARML